MPTKKKNDVHNKLDKMHLDVLKEKFANELTKESDRGAVVFAGTFFETQVTRTLLQAFVVPEILDSLRLTFDSKINLCYGLGYLTKYERDVLGDFRILRNKFAHNFDFDFDFNNEHVKKEFQNVTRHALRKSSTPRGQFDNWAIEFCELINEAEIIAWAKNL